MKKVLSLLFAVLLIVGSISGCADSGSGASAYRSLYSADVSTLNYLNTTTTNDMTIPANCEECLIEYDSLGNVLPALATELSLIHI